MTHLNSTSVSSSPSSAPPSDPLVSVAQRLASLSLTPPLAMLLSLAVVAAAAYGDAITTAATTFTLFYVLGVVIAVWYAGLKPGYVVAIAAVVGNTIASAFIRPRPTSWFLVWNAVLDLLFYVFFALVLSSLSKRMQEEIRARRDVVGQLRHAERLTTLGKLASGIAHEIGTPLNVISGRAELIASGELSQEAASSSAGIIIAQTERVSAIIRQLLDFARRGGTRVERTDLGSLAEHAALLLGPMAGKAGVEIRCNGARTHANVNPAELQQVLTNLLTNAIHAQPQGGKVELAVGSETARDPRTNASRRCAVVRVSDGGSGIPADVLPHIFEPFFTTRDVGVGTGLGLSVVHGIVQDHGGWIDVDTAVGLGTTMSVYLPQ